MALRPSRTGPSDSPTADPGKAAAAGRFAQPGKPAKAGKLSSKSDFDAVYRNGKRRSSSHFTVFLKANNQPSSRFGFSIKRAVGRAVVRNRMRRRIREVVRLHREEISAGWDFVIHPKASVATASFAVLTADLLKLLRTP